MLVLGTVNMLPVLFLCNMLMQVDLEENVVLGCMTTVNPHLDFEQFSF